MLKFLSRGLLVSSLAIGAIACSNNTTNTTSPSAPTTTNTQTFSGTLTTNGAVTHQFTAASAGTVTASLTTLSAASATQTVSLAIGTWNGTVCQIILANDSAAQGATVTGSVSTASNLCVRIADANGSIPGPAPYTITVTHP